MTSNHCACYVNRRPNVTLQQQILICELYAKHHGWILPESYIFVDDEHCGVNLAPALKRMLAMGSAKDPPFTRIVTPYIDISSDCRTFFKICKALTFNGINLYFFCEEPAVDTDNRGWNMVANYLYSKLNI